MQDLLSMPADLIRSHLVEFYKVNKNGIIQSPGKFEGEMLYVPYFWEMFLNGFADDLEWCLHFGVSEDDIAIFPELENQSYVSLICDDSGFVYET